jgi:hypothetical protein
VNYKVAKEHQWVVDSAQILLGKGTRKEALLGKPAAAPGESQASRRAVLLEAAGGTEFSSRGSDSIRCCAGVKSLDSGDSTSPVPIRFKSIYARQASVAASSHSFTATLTKPCGSLHD